ncbi:MAG: isochorismate synthase [Salinivirgaceae bacterium]|nr:isochorismate synthase [Salinivirgaceae bacterium]
MNNITPDKETLRKAIKSGISFAIWSNPEEQIVNSTFCNQKDLIKTYATKNIDKHKGFVFAPFQICKHLPLFILPFSNSNNVFEFNSSNISNNKIAHKESYTSNIELSKKEHISQVNDFIKIFKNTDIKKAVLSRNKWISDYNIDKMPDLFNELVESYPNAFVYQVFIPEAGYWVGATPELLLSSNNGSATTVSLAGTQPYNDLDKITWDRKEKVEQELVTEHIRTVLSEFDINEIKETGPETAKAGQLVHIKTQIDFNKKNINNRIGEFIERLHPTPAVCGLPVKDSLELILETEAYDREYYTGYLGTFDPNNNSNLYVNLRCLQAFENGVVLYAGGGITPESDAEKEWEETRLKIQTIEDILEKL